MQKDLGAGVSWERVGSRAVLFHFSEPGASARAAVAAEALQFERPFGIRDATAAFEKLLVEVSKLDAPDRLIKQLAGWLADLPPLAVSSPALHVIPVRYDGEDLAEVARHAGCHADEVVRRHLAPEYTVALIGFAPGFPYLDGLDPVLHTPRRPAPRTRLPAGAVAIGGSHTGIYSLPTPGGWNWIGNTDVVLFDPLATDRDDHGVLLRTGDRVQFIEIR